MDYKLQIISLLVSFSFGVLFTILVEINRKLISNKKKYLQNILTVVFIMDIVLLYILIIYKVNGGTFHLYFILLIIFGYITSYGHLKVLSRRVKESKWIAKVFRR